MTATLPKLEQLWQSGEEAVRVVITGGRNFRDMPRLVNFLDRYPIIELAHGAAEGADTQAGHYAAMRGIPVVPFPADWEGPCTNQCKPNHRRPRRGGGSYCPSAGVFRNQDMLDEFKPDLVIAFPGGRGTADMVRRATEQLGADRVIFG